MKRQCLALITCLSATSGAVAQEHGHVAAPSENRPWSQADAYYAPLEMEEARQHMQAHDGNTPVGMLMLNRSEVQFSDGEETGVWDADAWYGGDINKVWLKTEGDYSFDAAEFGDAEVQLLWSHAVSRYFDLQAGLRYDFEPDGLAHAVLGFQGLAPYWFDVDGAAFLSQDGDLTADFEAEYELRLTQRLILQPRLKATLSAQDIPERNLGSGLTEMQAGLRLRYEVRREFAPYVGVEHRRSFGTTADRIEGAGGRSDETRLLIGLRAWF